MIDDLCDFANGNDETFIHPAVKAIALHFMLGYIHPFADGNGRTARAVFYWYMLKKGYWIFEYLPISRIVLDAPVQYARAYRYTESDGADLTYFIHYKLRVIDRAVREMHEYFARQQVLMRTAREAVESLGDLNYRQIAVAYDAIQDRHAVFSIRDHAGAHAVTPATARADLLGLEEHGLLRKYKRGKRWEFTPATHLKQRLHKGSIPPDVQ